MVYLGIDIGSSATKLVAIDQDKDVVGSSVVQLGTGTSGVDQAIDQFYKSTGLKQSDITWIIATGYGRVHFGGANEQISEISCHAKGVHFLCPEVRTIIDIGGQDTKVTRVDGKGIMQNFTMNDKCAAGTGRFLDVMSKVLDVDISSMGDMDALAEKTLTISNTCTVFAESEVISKLAAGCAIPDVIAGIHESVSRRVAGLAFRNGIEPKIALTGGVAQNAGIIRSLERELKEKLVIPHNPQLTGALGAALFSLQRARNTKVHP